MHSQAHPGRLESEVTQSRAADDRQWIVTPKELEDG
jgi:hypothetical protein